MAETAGEIGSDPRSGLLSGPTIGDILDAQRGVGAGFDLCRFGLSTAVVSIHSSWLTNPASGDLEGFLHPFVASVLPIFFGLSGFLVVGSALRLRDLRTFITFRILRIMPALIVEVSLSAVILGSILTTWTLKEYYSDPRFYTYFGNIVGWIHFVLPGVFEKNPFSNTVNGNLWTLHPEFLCYGIMACLMISKIVYSRRAITWFWVACTIAGTVLNIALGKFELGFHFGGVSLVYSFLTGVVAYHWKNHIPANKWLALSAAILAYILLLLPHTVFVSQYPLIYIMMWLGVQKFPRIEFIQRGDYSYGIYLYGFPIQQTFIMLFPLLAKWWIVFPVTITLSFGVAALSWHFIEKPALKLKKVFQRQPGRLITPA